MGKSTLILMRHGESIWNKLNVFTGWVDVPLSEKGIEEALKGGEEIKDIPIHTAFTSTLIRAHMTLFLALLKHSSGKTPVIMHDKGREQKWATINSKESADKVLPVLSSWRLNERMYGDLQGRNKEEVKKEVGEEQFVKWRRSFENAPPNGESLKMTAKRTLPYFKKTIVPYLQEGKNVLVSAHGNSLRGIVMFLDKLSKEEIVKLEIPTGKPLIYEYEDGKFFKK